MKNLQALHKYLPEAALPQVTALLEPLSLRLKITRSRKSKRGDYRPLQKSHLRHQITINHDLNRYAFLITLIHEIAHLVVHERYAPRRMQPHGREWKAHYRKLLKPFAEENIFPADIKKALEIHLEQPTASSCTDQNLYAVLRKYDEGIEIKLTVSDLAEGHSFRWSDGRVFRKGSRLRTRFLCTEIKTGRAYRFHPMAEVEGLDV